MITGNVVLNYIVANDGSIVKDCVVDPPTIAIPGFVALDVISNQLWNDALEKPYSASKLGSKIVRHSIARNYYSLE